MDFKDIFHISSLGCFLIVLLVMFPLVLYSQVKRGESELVEVGVATVNITPEIPIRLTGFASREKKEADSTLMPLFAKALVFGSDQQKPTILITVDLVGISRDITKEVSDYLEKRAGIRPSQISISASHTHGGPEIGTLINILQSRREKFSDSLLDRKELIHIARYRTFLVEKLKEVAMLALRDRSPSYIYWGQGQATFAVNRRTKGGPTDPALPLLKIVDQKGKLRAVYLNYACHGTTLKGDFNVIEGDWIGEAQKMIESRHPGVTALISLGTAGDQNPDPRGTLEDLKAHGKEIADQVDKLLNAQLKSLNNPPVVAMKWVKLPLSTLPSFHELQTLAHLNTVEGYEARLNLERILRGEKLPVEITYPIQIWDFDHKMAMINLGGEVVVDYSILLKNKYGADKIWINAYSNDVSCYIPSKRILKEGGYEGHTNMFWYDQPAVFSPKVEDIILNAVDALMPEAFKEVRPDINKEEFVKENENGVYLLPATKAGIERGVSEGDHISYMPEWKAFGWFKPQDQAFWTVQIDNSGKYQVYLNWAVSDKEAGKPFKLIYNKKELHRFVEPTGSWFTYKKVKLGTIYLKKGINKITITGGSGLENEKGSLFDLQELILIPSLK